ncbi:hypothetical protein LOTGIDRAFT_160907 [Lottia gigantea]|uniref:MATH domain-containing protein n=1 Tax=Lottia gigantea TaxID=225164 RepID=V3ZUH9_LOTGI|nr:hypothetical protein LOTGIDRAFT_160907 [Lottia gigantea]ESO95143.1 hypothetical protein LOTGIDRAFT_160907 [Lottia gigantea]
MAKLCRLVQLNDRFNSQVFTFTLPGKITREFTPDTYAKEFVYGFQKWVVSFIRSERHIGAFLRLQTAAKDTTCGLDFTFTALNREHFTRNESIPFKGSQFTFHEHTHGRKNFMEMDDIVHRKFLQDNGDILIELEMRKINCLYENHMKMIKEGQSRHGYGDRLETTYFSFGLFDWSISLFPDVTSTEADGSVAVQLQRHTSFDHMCNVKYRVILGDDASFDSGELTQMLDASGFGDPFTVGASISRLSRGKSSLKVKVEMMSVVSVSEVPLPVSNNSKGRAHCYDRDKQAWMLETDTSGKFLSFRLYYTDISHVPRRFCRYVVWDLSIVCGNKVVKVGEGPYSKYYIQQDLDEGFFMRTNIAIDELSDPDNEFIDLNDKKLTIYIQWIQSHLLVFPNYNNLDDVTRLHKHQMGREIMALQAENYALEKQLYSYQQSIAKTNSLKTRQNSDPLLRH